MFAKRNFHTLSCVHQQPEKWFGANYLHENNTSGVQRLVQRHLICEIMQQSVCCVVPKCITLNAPPPPSCTSQLLYPKLTRLSLILTNVANAERIKEWQNAHHAACQAKLVCVFQHLLSHATQSMSPVLPEKTQESSQMQLSSSSNPASRLRAASCKKKKNVAALRRFFSFSFFLQTLRCVLILPVRHRH